jgi:hypothetical protein
LFRITRRKGGDDEEKERLRVWEKDPNPHTSLKETRVETAIDGVKTWCVQSGNWH